VLAAPTCSAADRRIAPSELAPTSIGDEALRNRWIILAVLFVLAAGNASDRHGPVLHRLICHDDARTCRRRRLRQIGRQRRRGIRFWRGRDCDLSVILSAFNRIPAALPKVA